MNRALVLALLLTTTACSLDRSDQHLVRVSFPEQEFGSAKLAQPMTSVSPSPTPAPSPTALSSFNCYALNVMGAGIAQEDRIQCGGSVGSKEMGKLGGFAPVADGAVEMLVPSGASRVIQLIGVTTAAGVGCPSLDALLNIKAERYRYYRDHGVYPSTEDPFKGIGDPFLIGQATADLFEDTTVTIQASFDPGNPIRMFGDCGDEDGGGSSSTTVSSGDYLVISGVTTMSVGSCQSIAVTLMNSSSAPKALSNALSIRLTSKHPGTFYASAGDCAGNIGSAIDYSIPANQSTLALYFRTQAAATDHALLAFATTEPLVSSIQFGLQAAAGAAVGLAITGPTVLEKNACTPYRLTQVDAYGNQLTALPIPSSGVTAISGMSYSGINVDSVCSSGTATPSYTSFPYSTTSGFFYLWTASNAAASGSILNVTSVSGNGFTASNDPASFSVELVSATSAVALKISASDLTPAAADCVAIDVSGADRTKATVLFPESTHSLLLSAYNSGGAGAFYPSLSGCQTHTGASAQIGVSIDPGASTSATVYYRGVPGTARISVQDLNALPLVNDGLDLVIN